MSTTLGGWKPVVKLCSVFNGMTMLPAQAGLQVDLTTMRQELRRNLLKGYQNRFALQLCAEGCASV
jgi:hypothetical protein